MRFMEKDYDESDSPIPLPKNAYNIILAGWIEPLNKIKNKFWWRSWPRCSIEPSYPEMGIIQGNLLPFIQ